MSGVSMNKSGKTGSIEKGGSIEEGDSIGYSPRSTPSPLDSTSSSRSPSPSTEKQTSENSKKSGELFLDRYSDYEWKERIGQTTNPVLPLGKNFSILFSKPVSDRPRTYSNSGTSWEDFKKNLNNQKNQQERDLFSK